MQSSHNRPYSVVQFLLLSFSLFALSLFVVNCGGGHSKTTNNNPAPQPGGTNPGGSNGTGTGGGTGTTTGGTTGGTTTGGTTGTTGGTGGTTTGTTGGTSGGTTGGTTTGGGTGGTAHFAFVLNASGATITGFSVGADGSLAPVSGSPFATPNQGTGLTFADGVLYASGGGTKPVITSYMVGTDGKLTQLSTTPTPTELNYGLYLHSSGKFLYATTIMGDIVGYRIVAPGQLTAIPGTPQSIGPLTAMTLSPDGKFLFLSFEETSSGGMGINTYAIDSNTGALTLVPVGPTSVGPVRRPVGREPQQVHLIVDPQSRFLFAVDPVTNNVMAFSIGSNGALTSVQPAFQSQGAVPFSLAATANNLYIGDFALTSISGYTIAGNGALTPVPGSPFKNDMTPAYWMVVNGTRLYVVDNDPGAVAVFNIGNDGALSEISGSPFRTSEMMGNNPSYIVFTQ